MVPLILGNPHVVFRWHGLRDSAVNETRSDFRQIPLLRWVYLRGLIGYILGLSTDDGEDTGSHYLGFRVGWT